MKQERLRLYNTFDHLKTDSTRLQRALFGKKKYRKQLQAPEREQMPWSYPGFPSFFFLFFIEVTSNLHVEVSVPLGSTKEAIPF